MIFSSRNDNHIIALLCTSIYAVGLEWKNNGVEKRSEPKQMFIPGAVILKVRVLSIETLVNPSIFILVLEKVKHLDSNCWRVLLSFSCNGCNHIEQDKRI